MEASPRLTELNLHLSMIIFEFYILSTGKLKTLRRVYSNVLDSGKDVEARGGSSVQLGLSSGRLEAHIHTFAPHSAAWSTQPVFKDK